MWLRYEFQSSYWWKQSMSFCLQYIQMLVFDYLFFSGYNLIVLVLHSVQSSFSVVSDSLWSHGLQHVSLQCPSLTLGAWSNSCPLSQWCHPTISSSIVPISSCLQSLPESGSFLMSQLFALGGQSIGASASGSVLLMNIQDWFPLGLTGLIAPQSKRLTRVFPNTTVYKHQFFSAQLSLWSNTHTHTWPQEKP